MRINDESLALVRDAIDESFVLVAGRELRRVDKHPVPEVVVTAYVVTDGLIRIDVKSNK